MMRLAAAVGLAACLPPTGPQREPAEPAGFRAPETSSAPPPPTPPPPPSDPFATAACPEDLSLAVARKLDGRIPADTQPGPYTKEHGKPVTANQLVATDEAIAKVIALETATPGVVPRGFRAELAAHARDPHYRLFMARCELDSPITTRRAGYDAGLALLLGASPADVLPLVLKSFYPGGTTSMSCTRAADCGPSSCDPVTRSCMSKAEHT
ncbi:MAG: hypothetical protein H6Q90_4998, partial [Deltaproteobacteria bacterium]|nr:hypothetical protein [Deltaproteobacteria bacterium]